MVRAGWQLQEGENETYYRTAQLRDTQRPHVAAQSSHYQEHLQAIRKLAQNPRLGGVVRPRGRGLELFRIGI